MLACSSCHGSGVNVMGERCFCPYGREGSYKSNPHPNGFIEGVKASISLLESELAKAPLKKENLSFKAK